MTADRQQRRPAARDGARAARASHRRPRHRGPRALLAFLLAAFLLVGIGAAAGIAWNADPTGSRPERAGRDTGPPGARTPTPTGAAPATPAPEPPPPTPSASASPSGPAPTDGPPGHAATPALPFDLPSPAALRSGAAAGKLVFAHYFTPYPLSLDNAAADVDYYTRNYLRPAGENGRHLGYGGLLRDRPPPVAPGTGDWEYANLLREVRTARAAGLDGFTLDLLSLSGKNWERSTALLRAAHAVDPGFKIMLMPDMTSLDTDDPAVLADALATLAASPAAHRLGDGRLVVSPFKAEAKDVGWWERVLDRLASRHGVRTAFVPLFLDFAAHGTAFAPISHGFSEWGSRSHVGQEGATEDVRRAHALGKIWMQPVSVQDARPNQGVYDEAGNTATLRSTWTHAIEDGADWVQLTTWNDYSEGSHIAPSLHNGSTYLDLTSYYLTRFKTGSWPEIVRDTLYLTSRTQFTGAAPTAPGQTRLMSLRKGSAAARDTVEVLSFLTASGTVRTTVGAAKAAHETPAGVHARLLPLAPGTSSARLAREGSEEVRVELPYPVERTPDVQDLQYYAATSGRKP
ncbi:glycoside hydrolase family 71 protein [Streptomyces sp. NPDC048606]|uniref:glycoside hydrolase family 71 protein n=1 Tax=Streptomyces sp. NPDC048606 TaxID=3154726 RepID=UPI00343F4C3A